MTDMLIVSYRSAWRKLWGTEPPEIRKVASKSYQIVSEDGESPVFGYTKLQRIVRTMDRWSKA